MNTTYRTLIAFLIFSVVIVPASSQDANTKKTEAKTSVVAKEEPRADGLKRISTRPSRDWDFDIHIDEEALEANIELAIENAMRDVEITLEKLEKLEIHIEPIEINLQELDLNTKPIQIRIPNLNIDIAPILIDLDDLDLDIDINEDFEHDMYWYNDHDNDEDIDEDDHDEDTFLNKDKTKEKDKIKEKDKQKNKSDLNDKPEKTDQKEKDKAKGLKKIN